MLVSEYRYVDNAATLGAKGLLADNRDVSRRRTPLSRLDDGAFFFEAARRFGERDLGIFLLAARDAQERFELELEFFHDQSPVMP